MHYLFNSLWYELENIEKWQCRTALFVDISDTRRQSCFTRRGGCIEHISMQNTSETEASASDSFHIDFTLLLLYLLVHKNKFHIVYMIGFTNFETITISNSLIIDSVLMPEDLKILSIFHSFLSVNPNSSLYSSTTLYSFTTLFINLNRYGWNYRNGLF